MTWLVSGVAGVELVADPAEIPAACRRCSGGDLVTIEAVRP